MGWSGMFGAKRFIGSAIAMLALASCSGGGDERTILTVATVNNGDMIRLKEFTGEFEKAHPDIRLKWVVLEENILRQRVTTDVAIRDAKAYMAKSGLPVRLDIRAPDGRSVGPDDTVLLRVPEE